MSAVETSAPAGAGKGWSDRVGAQVGEQEAERERGLIMSRARDMQWDDTKMAHASLRISPMIGHAVKTMHAHLDELAAGARSGTHRHASEAIMYVVKGTGYSTIDDVVYEWEQGDVFCIPAGAWHQHVNTSETETAQYFAVSNWPLTVAVGLGYLEFRDVNVNYGGEE